MFVFDTTTDRRIVRTYQKLKNARLDGDYTAIVQWMTLLDQLLDERLASREPAVPAAGPAVPPGRLADFGPRR